MIQAENARFPFLHLPNAIPDYGPEGGPQLGRGPAGTGQLISAQITYACHGNRLRMPHIKCKAAQPAFDVQGGAVSTISSEQKI